MKPVIRRDGEGRVLDVMGMRVSVRVRAEETGGAFSVVEMEVPAAFRAPAVLHRHVDVDWYGLVELGEVGIDLDGETHWVREGGIILVPRGVGYRWWNASDVNRVRWLLTYTPGGFERFFLEMAERLRALGHAATQADIGSVAPALWKEYRVETVPESFAQH